MSNKPLRLKLLPLVAGDSSTEVAPKPLKIFSTPLAKLENVSDIPVAICPGTSPNRAKPRVKASLFIEGLKEPLVEAILPKVEL